MSKKILIVGNLAKDIIDRQEYFGGSAANIALGVKRLGTNVSILSASAKDQFSNEFVKYLKLNGVDTSLIIQKLDNLPVCKVISKKNYNSSRRWLDNGSFLEMSNLAINSQLDKYDIVHLVSCPLILAKKISLSGAKLSYEPGPRLNNDIKYLNEDVIKRSHLLFFNEEEYNIAKKHNKKLNDENFIYPNLSAIIVTLGKLGSKIIIQTEANKFDTIYIPVINRGSSSDIDFTGAGDNYKAGFLAAFVDGRSLDECAKIGTNMAFESIHQKGGILTELKVKKIKTRYKL